LTQVRFGRNPDSRAGCRYGVLVDGGPSDARGRLRPGGPGQRRRRAAPAGRERDLPAGHHNGRGQDRALGRPAPTGPARALRGPLAGRQERPGGPRLRRDRPADPGQRPPGDVLAFGDRWRPGAESHRPGPPAPRVPSGPGLSVRAGQLRPAGHLTFPPSQSRHRRQRRPRLPARGSGTCCPARSVSSATAAQNSITASSPPPMASTSAPGRGTRCCGRSGS
jgi:hypothetical protein